MWHVPTSDNYFIKELRNPKNINVLNYIKQQVNVAKNGTTLIRISYAELHKHFEVDRVHYVVEGQLSSEGYYCFTETLACGDRNFVVVIKPTFAFKVITFFRRLAFYYNQI